MDRLKLLQVSKFLMLQSYTLYLFVFLCSPVSQFTKKYINNDEEDINWNKVCMEFIFRAFFTVLPLVFSSLYCFKIYSTIQKEETKKNMVTISPNSGFFVKFFFGKTGEVSMYSSPYQDYSTSDIVAVAFEMAAPLFALVIAIIILGFREELTLLSKVDALNDWISVGLGISMGSLLMGTFFYMMVILSAELAKIRLEKDMEYDSKSQ